MLGSKAKLPVAIALSTALMAGCGGGGSSSSGAAPSGGGGTPATGASLQGRAVKGPLVNAQVKAYAVDYAAADLIGAADPVDTGTTNAQAQMTGINLDPEGAPYIIVVEADADTTDLTTGVEPVITTMKTVVTADMLNGNTPVVATPLTSLATEVAASKAPTADTLQQSLNDAQNTVKSTLGFGLDESVDIFTASPVLTDDTDTPEEQAQVAAYRLAVEAVSAVLDNAAADSTSTDDSATDVLASLAQDLSDGVIDGKSGETPLPELSGVDVSSVPVADLMIPGTQIPVNTITTVLDDEAGSLGSTVTVDQTVAVEPEEVATVADTDFDGVLDDVDNCINTKNGADQDNQLDANGNGVGAACEAAPQISAVSAIGPEEGGPINVTLVGSDAEGDTLTFTVDGQLLPAGQSSYAYTPAGNFSGQVVLPYSVSDGESSSAESTITIDVTPVDDAPTGTLTILGSGNEGDALSLDNQLADADGPLTVVSYQWYADDVAIEGATADSFTPQQAQVGAVIRADVVVSDGVFDDVTVSSDTTAPVPNTVNNPTMGDVLIEGDASEGEALGYSHSLVDPDGMVSIQSRQWLADGAPIAGETNATLLLTQQQVGKAISLQLTYTDGAFPGQVVTTAATALVANVDNAATGSVTISGTPAEDQTLEALVNVSDEDGLTNVEYSYQWFMDGAALDGETTSVLNLDDSHVGKAISVQVDFTDDLGGSESVVSEETAPVTNVNDPVQGTVMISGQAMDTQVLSVADFLSGLSDDDGLPATPPAETTYQWKRDGVDIAGAAVATYTLVTADVGALITAEISFPDSRGTTETVLSAPTAPVAQFNNLPTGTVTITGDTQNQTWTVSDDLADADGPDPLVVSYQWLADGSPIAAETTSSFTPGQEYVGASISVLASYTDNDGNFTEVDSGSVIVLDADDAYTGGVTIIGVNSEDQVLSVTHDLADPDGEIVIVGYQWKASGADIVGATSDSLVLTQAEVGQNITVEVTFNDGVFANQVVTSSATGAVNNINDEPAGSLSIAGTPAPGNELSAVDAITDEDGMGAVSYEWFVDSISAGVGATYSVQQADAGLDVFVRASYVDGQETSETVDSAPVTVDATAQAPAFDPSSFSGQTVYDVYVEDGDDSACSGTTTFVRMDFDAGGTFSAADACDDSTVSGTWAFEQQDQVLVLSSPDFDQDNYVTANADVLAGKQESCWIDDADVMDSATALDICRNGESSVNYSLVDWIGYDTFYFNLADVHADTFDTKRFSHTWLAGRTLFDVWYGGVDTDGDCASEPGNAAGMSRLEFSADGLAVDVTGLAGDLCHEPGIALGINEFGQLGDSVSGAGINFLGNTDQYLEVVFRNEDGSPDNVDRFYHDQVEAQAAFNALPGANVDGATYTQNFVAAQLLKASVFNVHNVDGEWFIEKIAFSDTGFAELSERTADQPRFSDAYYMPESTPYTVSPNQLSLGTIEQGDDIYWHLTEDPNVGAGFMSSTGNGFEVCWGDCVSSVETFFFNEEAAQQFADAMQLASGGNPLIGSWLIDEGVNQRNILTFIDNTRYVVFHEHSNADQDAGSAEYGTYTWDQETGAFTATVIAESDGQGGLGGAAFTLDVNGDVFTTNDGFGADRIVDETQPIVGSWIVGGGDDIGILTILSDTEYAIVHTANEGCYTTTCPAQALSGEFGFYSWDGLNFMVTSVSVDTDGNGGLYNAEDPSDQENETIEVNGTTLTFTDQDEGPFVFERVGSSSAGLVCGYESGWDDMADAPLTFNSQDDYNTVVSDCDMQNGPLPAFSMADLANKTLYDGESEIVFDASGASGVATEYGDDGVKGTADDYSFFVHVSNYGTNQVLWEYSTTQGGAIEAYDLLTLLSSGAGNYEFAVFYEDYLWPESDGSVDLDTARKDGEIWYWNFSETEFVLTACDIGDGGDGDFTNTFADYEAAVSACSVSPRAITSNDLVGMSWDFGGESIVFYGDNTAVLDGTEGFTWSLDGTYLEMWADSGTYYDVYAIVNEAVNSNGNTVISLKVYNEDSAGDLVRETGADGDIWSSVAVITPPALSCAYQSGWDDVTEKPLIFNSISDFNEVRSSCEAGFGSYAFSTGSLASQTFYEEWNETRFVFDGTGTSAVVTGAGADGALDTADDETFYISATNFDTNVVKFEASETPGGPVLATELWGLVNYSADFMADGRDLWQLRVLFEDHGWAESDQSTADVDNKDGEIWHNSVSTASDFNWAALQ